MSSIGNVNPNPPVAFWPAWMFPIVLGPPRSFQHKIFLFLTQPHPFEQPAWLTQLVLAFLVWNSSLSEVLVSFMVLMLFTVTSSEPPPMSLIIAALTGTLIAQGRWWIASVGLLKLFVIDEIFQSFYGDGTEDMFSWHIFELIIMFTQYAALATGKYAWIPRTILVVCFLLLMFMQYILGLN